MKKRGIRKFLSYIFNKVPSIADIKNFRQSICLRGFRRICASARNIYCFSPRMVKYSKIGVSKNFFGIGAPASRLCFLKKQLYAKMNWSTRRSYGSFWMSFTDNLTSCTFRALCIPMLSTHLRSIQASFSTSLRYFASIIARAVW